MSVLSHDPLGYNVPLPWRVRYYPMGFPLIVETNSEEVLAVIDTFCSYWKMACQPSRPSTLRVVVENFDASVAPVPAMPCGQGHLVSIVHGTENFATCDVAASFGFARLTQDVVRDSGYLRYHFLEPIIWLLIDAAHLAPMHSSCVALNGQAVVLCGDSGAGKTSLAYACARKGWSYLSDDATHIVRERRALTVAGRPFRIRFRESARELFPELNAFPREQRPNGKFDIEVETRKLNLPIALESQASYLVFLNRSADVSSARLNPWPKEQASQQLRQLVCYGDERIRSEQSRSLDRLMTLPTLELKWRDLSDAEQSLRALVESDD